MYTFAKKKGLFKCFKKSSLILSKLLRRAKPPLPAERRVIKQRKDHNHTHHDASVVHVLERHGKSAGEREEGDDVGAVDDSKDVDIEPDPGGTPDPPGTPGDGLWRPDFLDDHEDDGDHVGNVEGERGQGEYGVKGGGGADLDEGHDEGDADGQEKSPNGDSKRRAHVGPEVGEWKSLVPCEGPDQA